MTQTVGRRAAVLDAAMGVLRPGGARSLTHRAVDRAAGDAGGAASNHVRTRRALVAGVLARVSQAEAAPLDGAIPAAGLSPNVLIELLAARIDAVLGPDRVLTVARLVLLVEAALDPALRPDLLARPSDDVDAVAAVRAGLGGVPA